MSPLADRDIPDDAERLKEAGWMAKKLAEKIIAERQELESDRSINEWKLRLLAQRDGQAAHRFMEKEQHRKISGNCDTLSPSLLEKELINPIEFVLRCIQVEQLEVPFIWTYRKDYLHHLMTVSHIWFIFDQDEQWEMMHILKVRLNYEIQALSDAAEGADESDVNFII
jgi:hypothetical protein